MVSDRSKSALNASTGDDPAAVIGLGDPEFKGGVDSTTGSQREIERCVAKAIQQASKNGQVGEFVGPQDVWRRSKSDGYVALNQ